MPTTPATSGKPRAASIQRALSRCAVRVLRTSVIRPCPLRRMGANRSELPSHRRPARHESYVPLSAAWPAHLGLGFERGNRPTLTPMSGIDAGSVDAFDDSFDAMGQFTDTVAGDLRDPYPGFVEKRRTAPVELAVQQDFDGGESPVANVYTYDTVAQVLRDNVTFSSGA